MSSQLLLTLLSASIGFVSGIFLCIGGVLLSKQAVMNLAKSYWGYNELQARSITSQSSQYTVGGLLLVISFLLQISAATTSPTTRIDFLSTLHPIVFVFVSVCITAVFAYLVYRNVNRRRIDRVLLALKERAKANEEILKKGS